MTREDAALRAAIDAYNTAARARFHDETGLRWLGAAGPVRFLGGTRVRGLFVDDAGEPWCDAVLFTESRALPPYDQGIALDQVCTLDRVHDLHVMTLTRGMHNALITPVDALADFFGLPGGEMPADNWARGWEDLPAIADREHLAFYAHAGHRLGEWPGTAEHGT